MGSSFFDDINIKTEGSGWQKASTADNYLESLGYQECVHGSFYKEEIFIYGLFNSAVTGSVYVEWKND